MDEIQLRKYLIIANVWLFISFVAMDVRTWMLTKEMSDIRQQSVVSQNNEPYAHLHQQYQSGKKQFSKCAICHHLSRETPNFGPRLSCILGQPIARKDNLNYRYSHSLKTKGANGEYWYLEDLHAFIRDPQRFAPGTRMPFEGLNTLAATQGDASAEEMTRQIIHYIAWSCAGGISESIKYETYKLIWDESGTKKICVKSSIEDPTDTNTYFLPEKPIKICSATDSHDR